MNKLMLSLALLMALPVLALKPNRSDRSCNRFVPQWKPTHATEAERERDANRLPVETLDFFGLDETMAVLELIPGGGWYTKLLAPALRDQGKLYVSIGAGRLVESGLLDSAPYDRVEVLEPELEITDDSWFSFEFGVASGTDFPQPAQPDR